MELIDIVDKTGKAIGYIKERSSQLEEHEFMLVTHIWIRNHNDLYLVQQRARSKETDPLLWSITSGFVACGETSLDTVSRELGEELAVYVKNNNINYVTRLFPKKGYKHIVDLYLIEMNISINEVMLQSEEVETIDYWSKEEIMEKANKRIFYNFNLMYDNYFNYIFSKED